MMKGLRFWSFFVLISSFLITNLKPQQTGKVYITFKITQNWGSGFQGEIKIKNLASWIIWDWELEFDLKALIKNIWGAQIKSKKGNTYTLAAASWGKPNIDPGKTVTIGFTASPGGNISPPTNGKLNGYPIVFNGYSNAPPPPKAFDPPVWPKRFFAPYVDVCLWPKFDIYKKAIEVGYQFYTLAFIVAKGPNNPTPSWGGYYSVSSGYLKKDINNLRSKGGDVIVSFGGAAGTELAGAAKNLSTLVNAYQSVIDAYKLTHIDFDVEGFWVADKRSIDLRSKAIALLQRNAKKKGKTLHVWLTLPVLPTGLTQNGLYVVESAVKNKVDLDGVNIMAMDYGDNAAPPPADMGKLAIKAAQNLFRQLKGVYSKYGINKPDKELWHMVGITPMIGLNDVVSEIFYQSDAKEVLAFAEKMDIGMLSFWSATRDKQHPKGKLKYVTPHYSSILQKPYEFSKIFMAFTPPWRDLGYGKSGTNGIPKLIGIGDLLPNKFFFLKMWNAPSNASFMLFAGKKRIDISILGGIFVPLPIFAFPSITNKNGVSQFKFFWPQGIPYGQAIYYQAWIMDNNASYGVSATNALESRNR